jgi:hypothetical protein
LFCGDDDAITARGLLVAKANKEPVETPPPTAVRLAGLVMRSIFIAILIVITARVASPQIEQLQTIYKTPDELIRVALGLAICIWLVVNLFVLPRDVGAYRTWFYLGFVLLPLSILCAVKIW